MPLDFGVIGSKTEVQSSDYKSAGSHQSENLIEYNQTNLATWETMYTVPTGQTFYVSGIWASTTAAASYGNIRTGTAGIPFANIHVGSGTGQDLFINIPTPIKLQSDTVIQVQSSASATLYTLIGWLE